VSSLPAGGWSAVLALTVNEYVAGFAPALQRLSVYVVTVAVYVPLPW
jgi:hypothetical protein